MHHLHMYYIKNSEHLNYTLDSTLETAWEPVSTEIKKNVTIPAFPTSILSAVEQTLKHLWLSIVFTCYMPI